MNDFRLEKKLVCQKSISKSVEKLIGDIPFLNKKYNDRYINSIYFDTLEYDLAKTNLEGISNRFKLRIRSYDHSNYFNYEIKLKKDHNVSKIVFKSNYKKNEIDLYSLFNSQNKEIKLSKNKFLLDTLSKNHYRPCLNVNYLRSYYLYKESVRLTFDQKINYSLFDTFNKTLDDNVILEIKFAINNQRIARELIERLKLSVTRNSKYIKGLKLNNILQYD